MEEGVVTFARAWVMAAALVPLVWVAYEWGRTARKLGLLMKGLALAAILAALAEPELTVESAKVAVVVLADESGSVSGEDLKREAELARAMERARGRNWVRVIGFARGAGEAVEVREAKFQRAVGAEANGTDLEAAVRAAAAAAPQGMAPKIALISDGKENEGSVARAAWQARQLGIPVDTFALKGRPSPRLRLEAVTLPGNVFSGERFPVDLTVSSPESVEAEVELSAEGKRLGAQTVHLDEGENAVRVHASVASSGALNLSGEIRAEGLGAEGEARFDRAVTLRRARVLFVTQDPAGSEAQLLGTLNSSQFEVKTAAEAPVEGLGDYQIVALNNVNLAGMSAARQEALAGYVKQGGGLLVIGGEREVWSEKNKDGPLDRVLPATIAPPRSPEGTCVVLIIDKSSSMEGKKIELARLAAIGVVDNLRPVDKVGVLIFDNSFLWAVPIRKAEDRALINRLVAGITPDGGTQIAPALSEAFHKILPERATYKHIVLLTDGISEEGDSLDLSKEAEAKHVTISTVGLGQDVNRSYLEKVAQIAGGKSYFLSEPAGLQQILLKDVMEHTGSTAVEKELKAEVKEKAEILEGVGMETAPALKGYVRFTAKPTAETVLTVEGTDPLLARWQSGLGRVAVFTSDAKARWAQEWVGWSGFDRFWANVFHDLLPQAAPEEARADFDEATGELTAEYRLAEGAAGAVKAPALYVLGPGGFERPMPVAETAPGVWRGKLAIGERRGLFRVRPLEESREFPEIGLYREEREQRDWGANQYLLRSVAKFTGGRFEPSMREVFDAGGRRIPSKVRFWPGLLAAALLLNLMELLMRKGPGVWAGRRRQASS